MLLAEEGDYWPRLTCANLANAAGTPRETEKAETERSAWHILCIRRFTMCLKAKTTAHLRVCWWIGAALPIFASCAAVETGARPRGAADVDATEQRAVSPVAPAASVSSGSPQAEPMRGMLEFFGIGRGERIADLGAGAGYSIERMAHVVGPTGIVYARHDPRVLVASAAAGAPAEHSGTLPENLVVMQTTGGAPFSAAARNLDLVTVLFSYHELVAQGQSRLSFNRAVFDALAPDRFYVIAEHGAPAGAGIESAREGRVDERVVRADVEAAGFIFVEAAQLLPSTAREVRSGEAPAASQYLLKFRRPR